MRTTPLANCMCCGGQYWGVGIPGWYAYPPWYTHFPGFPLGLENLEKWEGIFQSGKSQGILNRLEKSGKITQKTEKVWEFQKNFICYFF